MGPDDDELGVEAPDEAGVDAGVLRREDFVMMLCIVDKFGLFRLFAKSRGSLCQGCSAPWLPLSRRVRSE